MAMPDSAPDIMEVHQHAYGRNDGEITLAYVRDSLEDIAGQGDQHSERAGVTPPPSSNCHLHRPLRE